VSVATGSIRRMDPLSLLLGLVLGAALGAVAVALLRRRPATEADPALAAAQLESAVLRVRGDEAAQRASLEAEIAGLRATVESREREIEAAEARLVELVSRQQGEAAERRRQTEEQHRVLEALAPVKATLETMQATVGELEKQRAAQYGAIGEQLLAAQRSTDEVRRAADSLAASLRNTSVRGAWGESQLRRLVEAAGLTNRVDFDLQVTARSEEGVRRPDLVVRLPEGKCIAVDAKVPLAAFIQANEIPDGATGADAARREALLQDHVKAVRAHIDALSAKGYWTDLDSPEFVVAFLPSEALLSAALATDPTLLDYSFGKRVALASPVNLWAVLKTVAYTWNQQRLTDDAHRLFKLSETLYSRFGTLADRAETLRTSLERTVRAYNEFAGTLENRVLVTARQLKGLDEGRILGEAKPVETAPRMLTAAELTALEPVELRA
jgi:DNA recombination protein RmuC